MYREREDGFWEDHCVRVAYPAEAFCRPLRYLCTCANSNKVSWFLVISPHLLDGHRELAFQIAEQLVVLGSPLNARTAVVVGGMDMIAQAIELDNRPHVVVATPGRLVDHLRSSRGEWDLSRVKFLVCAIISLDHVVVNSHILRFLMKQTGSSTQVLQTTWLIYLAFYQRTAKQLYSRPLGHHQSIR